MDPRTMAMMNARGITVETLELVKTANPQAYDKLMKAITVNTGLVWYDLEPAAKLMYPVITPLRNIIPRVPGDGGTATHWKAITAINANKMTMGVSEGNRSGRVTTSTKDYTATYAGMGLEDSVSFEADYAGQNFDDVKALAVLGLLRSVMIGEEQLILWGDASFVLNGANNTTPTPTIAGSNTSGSLSANTVYYVRCCALTPQGYYVSSVAGNVQQTAVRTNADGTNDTINCGAAIISSANSANSLNKTSMALTVAAVKGAAAYAWYCGTGANTAQLTAITTVPKYTYTGAETQGNQTANDMLASAVDASNDKLVFDGLWSQIVGANSGAYFRDLGGNNLTVETGTPVITEIDVALKSFWDNYKLSPDTIWLNAQEVKNISSKVMSGNGTPIFRFNTDAQGVQSLTAGGVIGNYLNRYAMNGGSLINFQLHPNMPPGAIMFTTKQVPYPLAGVRNLLQMKMRRDYYQIEWPLRTRAYEYGVYFDGVLQNYFPPAFGLITGVNDG